MSISPQLAIWLNVIYITLTSISAPALQAAGITNAAQVVAIAALLSAPLNILLHAFSGASPGPLAESTKVSFEQKI
jgi:hypothetical protein